VDSTRHIHTQRMEMKPTALTQKPMRVEPEHARASFSNYMVGEASPTSSLNLNEIHVHGRLGREE